MLGVLAQHESLEWSHRERNNASRYGTDFVVMRRIGGGAYGVVYQVQHKLDGCIYALKRVKLTCTKKAKYTTVTNGLSALSDDSVQREVQTLSRIYHENIVRYYGAWIERHDDGFMEIDIAKDDQKTSKENPELASFFLDESSCGSSDQNVYQSKITTPICHLCQNHYKDWEVTFEQWGLINSVLQPLDLCTNCYLNSLPDTIDPNEIHIREQKQLVDYLYILMEYCEGTLMDAVKECHDDSSAILSYFIQCMQGLDYLHSVGIIHRDIKPNNIFVLNKVVKIGDFGLATSLPPPNESFSSDGNFLMSLSDSDPSSHVGTYLYAAPEVASGTYSEKCDVYSMGVVLVEIFSNFATAMERAVTLDKLRLGEFPGDFLKQHSKEAMLARQMLVLDPSLRSSCGNILNLLIEWNTPKEIAPSAHQPTADDNLHTRILELETAILERDITIQRLRAILKNNGISF
jgi:eukaryotic translation initiation factor 2-alpha kinase 4